MRSGPFFHLILIFFVAATSGCGVPKTAPTGGSSIVTDPGPAEEAYCSTVRSYSSPTVTITGTATYQAREITMSGSGRPTGLGSAGAARPIRHAEVMVKDSAGRLVQCAETDVSGGYEFVLPQDGKTYTVYVNSRANNEHLKASVLNAPDSNKHYSIARSFVADATKTLPGLNAEVTGAILGGAFNILDQLVKTNKYLQTQTAGCSYTGCVPFDPANLPKLQAYWKKGFDPGSYLGYTDPVSFYLPGYHRLFLLGGRNGDVDHSDTDHFDNSVIIHEYGHFLEDTVFKGESPGGQHNGNRIIDPRLAWSEGFANFLQAAILYDQSELHPYYIDTIGNSSGATNAFYVHLEEADRDLPNECASIPCAPLKDGEGIFREFSVTRLLWDALDTNQDTKNGSTDIVDDAFTDIWAALTKNNGGFNQPSLAFRNIGHFHLFQRALSGGKDFESIRILEHHIDDTSEYAQYVTTGSSCTYSLTPAFNPTDDGSFSTSDLIRNNDFFHLKISTPQTVTIRLDYWDKDGSGTEADVDLYVYNKRARYGVINDMVGYSEKSPDFNPNTPEFESIRVNLGAGDYLINVKVYTGETLGTEFEYTIQLEGNDLCPSSLL